MKRLFSLLAAVILLGATCSQAAPQPVVWSVSIDSVSPTQGFIKWHAQINDGDHIYGTDMPPMVGDIPTNPTTFTVNPFPGLNLEGELTADVDLTFHPENGYDWPWYDKPVTFSRAFTLEPGTEGVVISGRVDYMVCDISSCTPPDHYDFNVRFGAPVDVLPEAETAAPAVAGTPAGEPSGWWEPVAVANTENEDSSLLGLFIIAFLGGLVALLTPCVWPMIPMTVSFFLKTNKDKSKGVRYALLYSLSIVVIFVFLGLIFTLLFGAESLNNLATSAVFNVAFFILLVVFAISFMGAFEIKLPSKWSNAMDSKAESTTGIISIFFMAFTLVLVSFSCTSPIVGALLVEAVSEGNLISPLVGMTGFALGLALPFGLFAMFPSFLQGMPKSGGWLNSVKVVLGFIELILSLKFLSVADMAYGWRILDREVFIALWIVLFALLGMYLLGKLRFAHDSEKKHTSILGFFLAVCSFAFAVYLVPGLWGAPLKGISAFAPPISTQDFNLYGGEYHVYDDYDEGMQKAREEGKPVFVDFTGYGCVNCRKMEAAVFDTKGVRSLIEDNYVMIRLYVDEKKALPAPISVEVDGETQVLTTYGEKWSYLQKHKFGILSQPYYVLLDNEGRPLNAPRMYDEDVPAFEAWLEQALSVYAQ